MGKQTKPLRANTFREEAAREEEVKRPPEKPQKQPKAGGKPRKSKEKKSPKEKPDRERQYRVAGLFFLLLSIFLGISFASYFNSWKEDYDFSYGVFSNFSIGRLLSSAETVENWTGKAGALTAYIFISQSFGVASFLFALILLATGMKWFFRLKKIPLKRTVIYSACGILWFPVFFRLVLPDTGYDLFYGVYGFEATQWLIGLLGVPGVILLLGFILLSFLILSFNIPFRWLKKRERVEIPVTDAPAEETANVVDLTSPEPLPEPEPEPEPFLETRPDLEISEEPEVTDTREADKIELLIENPVSDSVLETDIPADGAHLGLDTKYDPTLDLPHYKLPPLDLLNEYGGEEINVNKEELEANKNRIVDTLKNYSIKIQKIKATIGPAVTLYEIVPEAGVRISRIKNLEDDIALSLSALGIRIIAPIPGKGTIGIEVPNQNPEIVSIRSLLASERFQKSSFDLPFVLGKTISNETFLADLTKMPHILMAGATGQGKSVGLNTIITSLLYKKHPSQIKFVMVDPKKVELSLFKKIERHFLAKLPDSEEAIITDTRKVVRTLNSLNIEMDSRYDLLQDAQVRNIREYNEKFVARKLNPMEGHRFLPYLILVVDEFADLIMTAGREIENPLTRLAQLARAVGIHLIIATQRPSVNIITGTIKANFPARIAFRVISKIDSRTILDSGGADQLVGRGDMLLSTGSDLIRLQCAFVDTPEIERLTEYIGSQRGYPDAFPLPEYFDEESEPSAELDPNEKDELFAEAARLIVQHQQGSTSLLQRKLKLGYNRAGRIIDQLESAGIVGPFEGSKAREVKFRDMMQLEQYLKERGEGI
ncbi:MAG TPA: DNA translocase FtsK 4TM domain-containing protein [Bacteroidales bacterium]|nr:DNA translocase FtsK 4TM domain-containing protein [Bacteroidales bacterium]